MRTDLFKPMTDVRECWYRSNCTNCGTEKCNLHCGLMQDTKCMLDLSELPLALREHQDLDVKNLNEESFNYIFESCRDLEFFVKKGFNAYFYGDVGTGKTAWAVYMLTNYFAQVAKYNSRKCRGLFISVPKLLMNIKLNMTYKEDVFYELIKIIPYVDLVVWDDIFQTGPTNFERQWLFSLIDGRIDNKKSNIFTSNITPVDFNNIDKRLYSRVCNSSDCIEFTGEDLRGRHKFSEYLKQERSQNNSDNVDSSDKSQSKSESKSKSNFSF